MVAIVYFIEALSVIMQIIFFKITGGKRLFKMTPIHHHFELCGWSETRIMAVFSIITALMSLIAYRAI
jgi:phospho-N-acetylmuramoyl-pentapeptide-transferase